jgi:DNA-binding transcriptional LysR family regulator
VLVASPAYLESHGEPSSIADLSRHLHIAYRFDGRLYPLSFEEGRIFLPDPVMAADSGEALRIAAINDVGIAQLVMPSVQKDLDSGALVHLLPSDTLRAVPVHFIHAFQRRLPKRVELFVDFVGRQLNEITGAV